MSDLKQTEEMQATQAETTVETEIDIDDTSLGQAKIQPTIFIGIAR